ncbi:ASMT methyltransferase, partial [Polypterus senegalus]
MRDTILGVGGHFIREEPEVEECWEGTVREDGTDDVRKDGGGRAEVAYCGKAYSGGACFFLEESKGESSLEGVPLSSAVFSLIGCSGALAKQCVLTYPEAMVTIFDLPRVVEMSKKHFVSVEENRISFQEGDFFRDPLPVADLYILARILHDWTDEKCVELLIKVNKACQPEVPAASPEGLRVSLLFFPPALPGVAEVLRSRASKARERPLASTMGTYRVELQSSVPVAPKSTRKVAPT